MSQAIPIISKILLKRQDYEIFVRHKEEFVVEGYIGDGLRAELHECHEASGECCLAIDGLTVTARHGRLKLFLVGSEIQTWSAYCRPTAWLTLRCIVEN